MQKSDYKRIIESQGHRVIFVYRSIWLNIKIKLAKELWCLYLGRVLVAILKVTIWIYLAKITAASKLTGEIGRMDVFPVTNRVLPQNKSDLSIFEGKIGTLVDRIACLWYLMGFRRLSDWGETSLSVRHWAVDRVTF